MTKDETVRAYAEFAGTTINAAKEVITGYNAFIRHMLLNHRDAEIPVGTVGWFHNKVQLPRAARNPQTNEAIWVEAKTVPAFKFARTFRKTLSDTFPVEE